MSLDEQKTLFLVWKEHTRGSHIPIGRLDGNSDGVTFRFLQGAHRAWSEGMGRIPEFPESDRVYRSKELFSFFRNRLMDSRRPDFGEYMHSLGLDAHDTYLLPFEVLERSEGRKVTDRFRLFRKPTDENGMFSLHCFVGGMTRQPTFKHLQEVVDRVEEGQRLFPLLDVQNRFDPSAIALKLENDWTLGYVPAYYSPEIYPLLGQDSESVQFHVVRVNRPAQGWLPDVVLVRIAGKWPIGWQPFEGGLYSDIEPKKAAEA